MNTRNYSQLSLFSPGSAGKEQPAAHFDGATYEPAKDGARLAAQLLAVHRFMADGQWHGLADIASALDIPEQSASARLRDLRKARNGSRWVNRRRVSGGYFEYRLERGTRPTETQHL